MSIAGIASSLFSQINNLQNTQQATVQNEFQQLAQDLQAGNLTQAQSAFAALQQNAPAGAVSGSPLSQAFSVLGQDLQSGNLTGAQQAFSNIQQDFQQAAQQTGQGHHHHHHVQDSQNSSTSSSQPTNPVTQLFNTLGQDLQSGNLTAAQQAYASLQQDMQLFDAGSSALASSAPLQVSA